MYVPPHVLPYRLQANLGALSRLCKNTKKDLNGSLKSNIFCTAAPFRLLFSTFVSLQTPIFCITQY